MICRELPTIIPTRYRRRVRLNGVIHWKGQELYVSQALSGQYVGLEPTEEAKWRLYFMSLELGQLDERKQRISRVSPAPPNGAPAATPRTPVEGSLRWGSRRQYPRLGPPSHQKV